MRLGLARHGAWLSRRPHDLHVATLSSKVHWCGTVLHGLLLAESKDLKIKAQQLNTEAC